MNKNFEQNLSSSVNIFKTSRAVLNKTTFITKLSYSVPGQNQENHTVLGIYSLSKNNSTLSDTQ